MMLLIGRYDVKKRTFDEAEVVRDTHGRFADEHGSGGRPVKRIRDKFRKLKTVARLADTEDGAEVFADLRDVYEGTFGPYRTKLSEAQAKIVVAPPELGSPKGALAISIEGKVYKGRTEIGHFARQIDPERGIVYNDQIGLDPEYTGQRFGDAFYDHTDARLAELGITEAWLHANTDVGGYAQARRGYDFRRSDPEVWRRSLRTVANRIETLLEERGDDLTPADRAQLIEWEKGFRAGERRGLPTAPDLAAFGEGRYDWTDETKDGRSFPTWPGKAILLGADWDGYKLYDEDDPEAKAWDARSYRARLEEAYDAEEARFEPGSVRKPRPGDSDFNLFHVDLFLPPQM